MSITQYPVFTVGHSNHPPAAFITLLVRHGIDEIADVRSAPYSRYTPHFNHDALQTLLDDVGIGYAFLGGELGGRPSDRSCYDAAGRVRYDKVAETDAFDDGIRRIIHNADDRRIALLCSEKEPLECHRTLLSARNLAERGVAIEHILADGALERRILLFPVATPADILAHRQLAARDYYDHIEHPDLNITVPYPGNFVKDLTDPQRDLKVHVERSGLFKIQTACYRLNNFNVFRGRNVIVFQIFC